MLPHYRTDIADSYGPQLAELAAGRSPLSPTHIAHRGPAVRVGDAVNVFRCGVCGDSHGGLRLYVAGPNAFPGVTAHATCPTTGITLDLSLPLPVEPTPSSPAVDGPL